MECHRCLSLVCHERMTWSATDVLAWCVYDMQLLSGNGGSVDFDTWSNLGSVVLSRFFGVWCVTRLDCLACNEGEVISLVCL